MSTTEKLVIKYKTLFLEQEIRKFLMTQSFSQMYDFNKDDKKFIQHFKDFQASKNKNEASEETIIKSQSDIFDPKDGSNQNLELKFDGDEHQTKEAVAPKIPANLLIGLNNIGPTFYFNSLIQILYHMEDFRKFILSLDISTFSKNNKERKNLDNFFQSREYRISTELQKLFIELQSPKLQKDISSYYVFFAMFEKNNEIVSEPNSFEKCLKIILESVYSVYKMMTKSSEDWHSLKKGVSKIDERETNSKKEKPILVGTFPESSKNGKIENNKSNQEMLISDLNENSVFLNLFRGVVFEDDDFQTDKREKSPFFSITCDTKQKTIEKGLDDFFQVDLEKVDHRKTDDFAQKKPKLIAVAPKYLMFVVNRPSISKENYEELEKSPLFFTFPNNLYVDQFQVENETLCKEIRRNCMEKMDEISNNMSLIKLFDNYGQKNLNILRVLVTMEHYCKETSRNKFVGSSVESTFFYGKLNSSRFGKAFNSLKQKFEDANRNVENNYAFIRSAFDKFKNSKFSISSIVIQTGSNQLKHFYVYIKIKGHWFCFNDSRVFEIDEKDVLQDAFGKRSLNSIANCIFFEKD